MGLTTWKNAPSGKISKSDVTVAKNYLSEQHIKELNRIVSAYLDLAENRAERRIPMTMGDWASFLDSFLDLSNCPILTDKGKVSALEARLKAEQEYEKFRSLQDRAYLSDFDREIQHLTAGKDEGDQA
ncbi:MAG: RhuM family protein [Anaerolineales bacterium]